MEELPDDALRKFSEKLSDIKKSGDERKEKMVQSGVKKLEKRNRSSSALIMQRLSKLRQSIGMTSIVGAGEKIKSPRVRRGPYLQMLAMELLLLVGEDERDGYTMDDLEVLVKTKRSGIELSDNDIPDTLKYLHKKGIIPSIEGERVYFAAVELSSDIERLLSYIEGIGDLSISEITVALGWDEHRVRRAVSMLVETGVLVSYEDRVSLLG